MTTTTRFRALRFNVRNMSYIALCRQVLRAVHKAPAQIVANGSFEQGLAGWSTNGHPFGLSITATTDACGSQWAAAVTGRKSYTNGVCQDISAGLASGGTGVQYVTRFSIKVDEPSVVRARLLVKASGTTNAQLLAERMVHRTGEWVHVRGNRTIHWNGALQSAKLYFEVGRNYEFGFPSFSIDELSIHTDADGDWVPDAEEPSPGAALAGDAEDDGMPDAWEMDFDFNPTDPADGAADTDLDGFSN